MKISEAARRYARALFETVKSANKVEETLADLRAIKKTFSLDLSLNEFFLSPTISPELKRKMLDKALEGKTSQLVLNYLHLIVDKRRFNLFNEILDAYQELCDAAHGVTRGTVRSAQPLGPEDRIRIEETVNKVTGKKVILSFEEDATVLGGLVAQVAGFTFDDSLSTHLLRINDALNRRVV